MKITIDVERLSKEELHFFEQIGEGYYDDVEFKVFSTVPQRSLEIWVEDERYLISSEELIRSVLQSVVQAEDATTLEAIIEFYGDPSVGIFGGSIKFDLPTVFDNKEQREFTRQKLNKCFSGILDDGNVKVRFSDEPDIQRT
jgi:hypothetical protein